MPETADPRTAPRAAGAMAEMFDQVSGRYDLLNAVMSLGQDRAWREAMWRGVPESARVVLDLCSGSGVSLDGLRRPGRLVIGADVSLGMLELAATRRPRGWAPRLLCADAFALPLPDASLDAITIAFGLRNLRPRRGALAEMARVLRPGGALSILEATAPARGPLRPFHRFYLEKGLPLAGRLSDDPSAYRYLGRSILEFGTGEELEAELGSAGLRVVAGRRFLFGATRLWVARRASPSGQIASDSPGGVQNASPPDAADLAGRRLERERRAWGLTRAAVSGVLAVALGYGTWVLVNSGPDMPLRGWHRSLGQVLAAAAALVFGFRAIAEAARWMSSEARK